MKKFKERVIALNNGIHLAEVDGTKLVNVNENITQDVLAALVSYSFFSNQTEIPFADYVIKIELQKSDENIES